MKIFIYSTFLVCWLGLSAFSFGDGASSAVTQGNKAMEAGAYDAALGEYKKAQQSDPDEPVIDYNLGAAYFRLKNYGEAVKAFERVSKIDDDKLAKKALFNLAATRYMAGEELLPKSRAKALCEYDEAVKIYKRLLTGRSDNKDAVYNLELAMAKQKRLSIDVKCGEEERQEQDQNQDQDQQNKGDNKDEQKNESTQNKKQENDEQSGNNEDKKESARQPNDQQKKQGDDDRFSKHRQERIDPEQAKRILKALEQDEKKLKRKIRSGKQEQESPSGRDW